MKIIRPVLEPKAKIGVVSPSSWDDTPDYAFLRKLGEFWESKGHPVYIHPQNYLKDGLLAGSDEQRAGAFMEMVTTPEIGAIMFTRGCTGAVHILDRLDYALVRKNPKPIIGFSDTTVLLNAITQKSGLVTFYGPMGFNFANPKNDPRTGEDLLTAVSMGNEKYKMEYRSGSIKCLREGEAEGTLVGGHINRLQLLLGTPYNSLSSDREEVILFFETVESTRLEIDNLLSQFRLAGILQRVRGVIVGELLDIQDGETSLARHGERSYGYETPEIIAKHVQALPNGVPVVCDFPCGHGDYLSTLPIGSHVHMTAKTDYTELSFG